MRQALGLEGTATAAWMVVSRFGKKIKGAKTLAEPIDPNRESLRRQITDSLLQGAPFTPFQQGGLGIPAIACNGVDKGIFSQRFAAVDNETQRCVALDFDGAVLQLTPPGPRNMVVAVVKVKQRSN